MIIAAVGKNASGKDYFLEYISKKYGLPMFSMGDIVRQLAEEEGLEKTRENLHLVSKKYMSRYGSDFFPESMINKIKNSNIKNVLISGIRPLSDVIKFKNTFGKEFILVAVVVIDDRIRFERMKNRGSDRDPQTYEKFLEYDKREEELFQTSETIKLSDYVIYSGGPDNEYHLQIEKLYENIISQHVI